MKRYLLSMMACLVMVFSITLTAAAEPKVADNKLEYSVSERGSYDANQTEPVIDSASTNAGTTTPQTITYVLNASTKKFHVPTCSSVKQMKDKNKKAVDWSREEIINAGYEPCKKCKP